MKEITITINRRKIRIQEECTVLEAATTAGIYIPTLCQAPNLKPYGACRLCIVHIDGMKTLPTSCTTQVREGMVVETETDEIQQIRRMIIELAIADHPYECLTCPKSESCELLKVARYLEVKKESIERFRCFEKNMPEDRSNPAFDFDPNKCILCGKCVRTCNEIQMLGAIDFAGRGYQTRISTFGGSPWSTSICQTCGECVDQCPTGALSRKHVVAPEKKVVTLCPFCGVGCSVRLGVRANTIVFAEGDMDSPVNHGELCVKGRFGLDFIQHGDRLKHPLIRKKNVPKDIRAEDMADIHDIFYVAEWDEAIQLVADRLNTFRDRYSPDALGFLSSAKCTNEENYIFQKFARAVVGTHNVDHCARLCHASTVAAALAAFGDGAMSNSISDIAKAHALLVVGSNTTECHPVIGRRIKQNVRRNNARLVVADPRKTELTREADVHLGLHPGTDVALLNGIMHWILENNWQDQSFIENRCEDFDLFKKSLEDYTPDRVASITGISSTSIKKAAEILATSPTMAVVYGMGATQHTTGTDNIKAIANLLMLTGNMGRPGTGFSPLRGQNNVQGACDMGALPNVYPGYQRVTDAAIQAKFSRAWNTALKDKAGLPLTDMIPAAEKKQIKCMYIMGENPLMSEPDLTHARKAFGNLEFLVVQDIFITETALFADVILPAAGFAEKTGTFTNTERCVQLLRKALEPPGMAREDWQIIADIATAMGHPMIYPDSSSIMDEISLLTPIYGGISHDRLNRINGLQWPCWDTSHPGTPRLHEKQFTRGKGKFHAIEYRPPAESPSDDYPMVLTTGRMLEHFHTGSMSRHSRVLKTIKPEGYVSLSPEDMDAGHLKEGDAVCMESPRGRIRTKAHKDEQLPRGLAFMTFHWKEAPVNELTNSALDPVSRIPEFKVSKIRTIRISEDPAS